MQEKVIITQEELNSLKKIQDSNNEIVINLGMIELKIHELNILRKNTLLEFDKLKEEQDNFGKLLSSKYGQGTVDLGTGEFIKS